MFVIVNTSDHSKTLFVPELNEHYHSTFGAVQESEHVFIRNGLQAVPGPDELKILEIGFGTGLNALLTMRKAEETKRMVIYHAIEAFPVPEDIWQQLDYDAENVNRMFRLLHESNWNEEVEIAPHFMLKKIHADLTALAAAPGPRTEDFYDLVYFDAFGPDVQPEMWTDQVFSYIFSLMNPGGILVTYSVKGTVKRSLKAAGFTIEKLPGPAGKREMLRAGK